jgi:dihydropteroate synthase
MCAKMPMIMGILNVTPDSFSDGGRHASFSDAIRAARCMLDAGADIIDIGGESTRPGAEAVDVAEELRRVIPLVDALQAETDAIISVDTSKAAVARRALQSGAHIINDVSAMTADPDMLSTVAEFGAGVVLMHMRGTPRTMQNNPEYGDVVSDITAYLRERIDAAIAAGIPPQNIAIDPGIGFGKTTEHNLQILSGIPKLIKLGHPVLIGLSRKRFLGILTGAAVENRLSGSLAGLACAVLNGAHIMRVHDVTESKQAARIAAAVRCPANEHKLKEMT